MTFFGDKLVYLDMACITEFSTNPITFELALEASVIFILCEGKLHILVFFILLVEEVIEHKGIFSFL